MIVNEAKIKNGIIRKVREQLEHRAIWLALIMEEAEKQGLDLSAIAEKAIFKCGCLQGKNLNENTNSFKKLKKNLFTKPAQWVFEMKIKEVSDDKLSIDFYYCPLVKAWQKLGLSEEKIAKLCDIAMSGDRGIAENFNGKLNLEKVIAKGDSYCKIRFIKNEEKSYQ